MSESIAGIHVFVVMPFGIKNDADGRPINFDAVYRDLILGPLSSVGADVFRADFEERAGDILADMFQELLLADLVVADITIDNPNAWYELGVRHALRPRGTVMLQGGRARIPFDIGPNRVFKYHLMDGKPDPQQLETDRRMLISATNATWGADETRQDSPVFANLPTLEEPEWRRLRVGELNSYWRRLEKWQNLIDAATQRNRPGDILVLADEPPARPLRAEAMRIATSALVDLGRNRLALKIAEQALELAPRDVKVKQKSAIARGRLGNFIEAKQILDSLRDDPSDEARASIGETLGIAGAVAKREWIAKSKIDGVWQRGAFSNGLLQRACKAYSDAFQAAPTNYFPGINAVTLGHLYKHIAGTNPKEVDVSGYTHGLRWALSYARRQTASDDENFYWIQATEAEMHVLEGDPAQAVEEAYATAAAAAQKWFQLDSSLQQLRLLEEHNFQPDAVAAGKTVLQTAIRQFAPPEQHAEAKHVILFSGHMIDNLDQAPPRFPKLKVDAARLAIARELDQIGVDGGDIGFCGGACGGDLLFAEECLKRGLKVHIYIPEEEAAFLNTSISFAGPEWRALFFSIVRRTDGRVDYRIQPQDLGSAPTNISRYDRNNRWLAHTALCHGLDRLEVICLWDGAKDDARGPNDMIDLVNRTAGSAPRIINPSAL